MREFQDHAGRSWNALAVDCTVAHQKQGACLAFRPTDEADGEPLTTSVTFNSMAAAESAIRTIGLTELQRRLQAALATATR
jgi:hypothetical protein